VLIAMVWIIFPAWVSITEQNKSDYRHEPVYWQEIASYLPTDGKIVALTQDYGYRLMYYGWRKVKLWPNRGERNLSSLRGSNKEFEGYFTKRTDGKDYFLITAFGQFRDQEDLQQMLYDNYPIHAEGDGYLIFNLTQPITSP
jgi:beta-galactosidase/beta-glucuronidase